MTKVGKLLDDLGIPVDRHGAIIALHDQVEAWREDHPGEYPDGLLIQLGVLAGDCFGAWS